MLPLNPQARGLSVRPLGPDDIEKVRLWRNSDHVRSQMVFQEIISDSSQIAWFESVKKNREEHFIYAYQGQDVGLVSIKPREEQKSFEGGIFCGDKEFLGHHVNLYALLWLYDHAFEELGMEEAFCLVRESNEKARRVNQFLGFTEEAEITVGILSLKLDRSTYSSRKQTLRLPGAPDYGVETFDSRPQG